MTTAVFTGAGASYAIGYPLTRELLPRVREGLRGESLFQGLTPHAKQNRKELRRYLTGLLPGFNKATDEGLPLITDVFSLVEYAMAAGDALPIGSTDDLKRCRDLLKYAITAILLEDFHEPWDTDKPLHKRQKRLLRAFAEWIGKQGGECGLITTNYDIGIEFEMYDKIGRTTVDDSIDIGFDWRHVGTGVIRKRPTKPCTSVFKLHGSLDQLRCPACGYVYFNPWSTTAHQPFRETLDAANSCHCYNNSKLELHIVSPSFVRDIRDGSLLSVWRSALEWMRTADDWIIVGYSLPPEDLAIRSLLVRAYSTASPKPKITVVQWDYTERDRYRMLFPKCEYRTGGLEAFFDGTAPAKNKRH
jgi:hypothetical protein